MSTETSTRDAETVVDRKGKRKADESAGEEQDGSADALPEGSTERVKSSQASKSKSTKARLKKGRVADLRREEEDDSQLSNQPPDPGTPARSSRAIPINTQETPAIQRNLAMRAGLGHGAPPGTPGSARRTSSDMRGRRGSSIGNGMEGTHVGLTAPTILQADHSFHPVALPHPSLPSNTLYRHIKADDPPAVRFRTLVAWSAHRVKDKAEAESSNASSAVRAAASSVMDSLISDLMEKRIDLGWQAVDPANVGLLLFSA